MKINSAGQIFPFFIFALAVALIIGCKTTPSIDWNSRVGIYTQDQAVSELGPPDKQAVLSSGNVVDQWITHRNGGSSFSFGTGFFSGPVGMGVGQSVGSNYPDHILTLTFGREGKLVSWSKNY